MPLTRMEISLSCVSEASLARHDSPESSDKLNTSSVLRVRALFPVNGLGWRKCGYRLRYGDSVGVLGALAKRESPWWVQPYPHLCTRDTSTQDNPQQLFGKEGLMRVQTWATHTCCSCSEDKLYPGFSIVSSVCSNLSSWTFADPTKFSWTGWV